MLRPSRWVMAVSAILIMIAGPVHARPRATVAPIQAGYRIPNSTLSPLASCSVPIPELQTDTTTAMVMATCSVTATAPGTLVILADGTTTDWPDAEARFDVRVNGLIVQTQYVDSYQDPVSFALRAAVTIQPGSHTVTLSMARRAGTGHVSVSGGNLSSIAVPAGRPDIVVCGASTIPPFTTTSSGYSSPASCSIQAPSAGTVLILASANHYFVDAYAEANYRVGEPGVTALAHSDRGLVVKQVNATDDGGDGVDSAVTTMGIMPVVAGQTLEVGLLMRRS